MDSGAMVWIAIRLPDAPFGEELGGNADYILGLATVTSSYLVLDQFWQHLVQ